MPFFCRTDRGAACEDSFSREIGRWLPHLPEFDLPPLNGQMLCDVVAVNVLLLAPLTSGTGECFKPFQFVGMMAVLQLT